MNYLELAKAVAQESGSVDPNAITAVTGLTGRPNKIVSWVEQAYTNIQNSRRDWGWLVTPFSADLIAGTGVYTPASFNLTRFSNWVQDQQWFLPMTIYDHVLGTSDENPLRQIAFNDWETLYDRGDTSSDKWQRPVDWAVSPRGELCFGPLPDKVYTVRGQYQKGPQTLTDSTDIPEMPLRFHRIIVWEALRLSMIHDGAYQEAQVPTLELVGLRYELEMDQLPEITL